MPGRSPGSAKNAVVLHRRAGQTLTDHGDFTDRVGPLEGVDILAVFGAEADVGAVFREEQRRISCESLRRGDYGLERLVIHDDSFGGVGCGRLRGGHDGGDDIAHKADDIFGENRSIECGRHHREALERGQSEIVAGVIDGLDPGHRLSGRHVDAQDLGVSLRGTDKGDVKGAGRRQVI